MWPQALPGRTGAPPVLSLPVSRCSMTLECACQPMLLPGRPAAVHSALLLAKCYAVSQNHLLIEVGRACCLVALLAASAGGLWQPASGLAAACWGALPRDHAWVMPGKIDDFTPK